MSYQLKKLTELGGVSIQWLEGKYHLYWGGHTFVSGTMAIVVKDAWYYMRALQR